MAYDILKGAEAGRSWSRGDSPSIPVALASRLKWGQLVIGLGLGAAIAAIFSKKANTPLLPPIGSSRPSKTSYHRHRTPTRPTIQIPVESMSDVTYGRRT